MTRLVLPVGKRDHLVGAERAAITLMEYGNYECSRCAQAESIVTELRRQLNGELRFAYRHFPPKLPHSASQRAAEAAEAAGAQGKFWLMHRMLLEHTHNLDDASLALYAVTLELDIPRFLSDLKLGVYAAKVGEDFQSGLYSGVHSSPTFFINGVRHDEYWDADTLLAAIESRHMETKDRFRVCPNGRALAVAA